MIRLEVDGIVTDRPDLLAGLKTYNTYGEEGRRV